MQGQHRTLRCRVLRGGGPAVSGLGTTKRRRGLSEPEPAVLSPEGRQPSARTARDSSNQIPLNVESCAVERKEPRGGVFPAATQSPPRGESGGATERPLGTLRQQVYARPPWLILQTILEGAACALLGDEELYRFRRETSCRQPFGTARVGEGGPGAPFTGSRRDSAAGFSLSPTEGSRAPRTELLEQAPKSAEMGRAARLSSQIAK